MKLHTQIPLKPASNPIGHNSKLLLLGSCFVENIGKKLGYFKFRSLQNPFGILFHPKAIENLVRRSIQKESYTEKDIFFFNERWHCFDAHSNLSDISQEMLLQKLNRGLHTTREQLENGSHIIITLGTAWAYRYNKTGLLVGNCHKVPQKEFSKELLSIIDIEKSLRSIMGLVGSVNRNIQIILTVSPVRHLKDGFVENQRSKAHLVTAVHQALENPQPTTRNSYFCSYELMMDELRDYRFYTNDMIHPNSLAVDYIWEKFKHVWISEKSYPIMEQVDSLQKGLVHRPFNPRSEQHQMFLKSLQKKIDYLKGMYPFMRFGEIDISR